VTNEACREQAASDVGGFLPGCAAAQQYQIAPALQAKITLPKGVQVAI